MTHGRCAFCEAPKAGGAKAGAPRRYVLSGDLCPKVKAGKAGSWAEASLLARRPQGRHAA